MLSRSGANKNEKLVNSACYMLFLFLFIKLYLFFKRQRAII